MATDIGKIETEAQFLAMKPERVCWRPATMKIIFCFYSRVFSKKRIKVTIELAFLFVSMLQ